VSRASNHHPIIDWLIGASLFALLFAVGLAAIYGVKMAASPSIVLID